MPPRVRFLCHLAAFDGGGVGMCPIVYVSGSNRKETISGQKEHQMTFPTYYFQGEVFVPMSNRAEKCEIGYRLQDFGIGASAVLTKVICRDGKDILDNLDEDIVSALEDEAMAHFQYAFAT